MYHSTRKLRTLHGARFSRHQTVANPRLIMCNRHSRLESITKRRVGGVGPAALHPPLCSPPVRKGRGVEPQTQPPFAATEDRSLAERSSSGLDTSIPMHQSLGAGEAQDSHVDRVCSLTWCKAHICFTEQGVPDSTPDAQVIAQSARKHHRTRFDGHRESESVW